MVDLLHLRLSLTGVLPGVFFAPPQAFHQRSSSSAHRAYFGSTAHPTPVPTDKRLFNPKIHGFC